MLKPQSLKAVESKQLSPRLAGESLGMPNTTVYLHVAKTYAKFGAGRLAITAVLGEGVQKSLYGVVGCFLSWDTASLCCFACTDLISLVAISPARYVIFAQKALQII